MPNKHSARRDSLLAHNPLLAWASGYVPEHNHTSFDCNCGRGANCGPTESKDILEGGRLIWRVRFKKCREDDAKDYVREFMSTLPGGHKSRPSEPRPHPGHKLRKASGVLKYLSTRVPTPDRGHHKHHRSSKHGGSSRNTSVADPRRVGDDADGPPRRGGSHARRPRENPQGSGLDDGPRGRGRQEHRRHNERSGDERLQEDRRDGEHLRGGGRYTRRPQDNIEGFGDGDGFPGGQRRREYRRHNEPPGAEMPRGDRRDEEYPRGGGRHARRPQGNFQGLGNDDGFPEGQRRREYLRMDNPPGDQGPQEDRRDGDYPRGRGGSSRRPREVDLQDFDHDDGRPRGRGRQGFQEDDELPGEQGPGEDGRDGEYPIGGGRHAGRPQEDFEGSGHDDGHPGGQGPQEDGSDGEYPRSRTQQGRREPDGESCDSEETLYYEDKSDEDMALMSPLDAARIRQRAF